MVTAFRSMASLTRRSASARISCFDIQPVPLVVVPVLHLIPNWGNKTAGRRASHGKWYGTTFWSGGCGPQGQIVLSTEPHTKTNPTKTLGKNGNSLDTCLLAPWCIYAINARLPYVIPHRWYDGSAQ